MLLQILNYSNDKANTKKQSSELSRGQTSRREAAGARGPPRAPPPRPGRAATRALGGANATSAIFSQPTQDVEGGLVTCDFVISTGPCSCYIFGPHTST